MAAPFFNTPIQPYVYQSPQEAVTPFQILGGEAQIVQIMLKPQEKVIARPGSMCYTSGSIQMDNVFIPEQEVGVLHWVFGKSVTSIILFNSGSTDGFVGIAAPSLARILPIDLAMFGGELLCQPDAFLCSLNDVKVSNTSTTDLRARNVVAGAEDLVKIVVDDYELKKMRTIAVLVFADETLCDFNCCENICPNVGRSHHCLYFVVQKILEVGEVLAVDASCIVAMTTTINAQVKYNGPMRRAVFGADNLVTAILTGPGIVFIQSLPFQRLSQRVARAVTAPNVRENPKLFIQLAVFFLVAYVVIISSLLLVDV
ncbi:hypothetical protein KSS87_011579 [Heliosperma pusillum]|nr:hypothetical protein KSS87_015318 [Heliosperma pusillum]KAH9622291.1 hypothetical protein KSS87_011579 [Heliosperma pusillum]